MRALQLITLDKSAYPEALSLYKHINKNKNK